MLRKSRRSRRNHLAIVVFPTADAAFNAYRLLQQHGISPEHIAIVGKGFNRPERVGLLEPMQHAIQAANYAAFTGGSIGFAVGLAFVIVMQAGLGTPITTGLLLTIPTASICLGFVAAVGGGLIGFLGEGSAASVYRYHLRQGHYLVMLEGTEKLVNRGQDILGEFCGG